VLTLLHLPGFDSCPKAWIESRPPPDFSAHSFASAGIRSMSRCMDRIPGPPVLFCICQDSIEVQEPGSNPGPPRLQCTGFARIRSRSRYMDQILRPDQRGRCHPIKQFYKVTPHFRQKRNYFFPALIRHYEAANMFISFVYHIFYKSKHQQKIILTFLIWHIL